MTSLVCSFTEKFLGQSPTWYKKTIFLFLLLNPLFLYSFGPFITGWILVVEFIFTLAFAMNCYPLQSGGLLVIQSLLLGLATTEGVYKEIIANLEVLLLLIFMVSSIHFMKDLLLLVFSKILLSVRSKTLLSLFFCFSTAILSTFFSALTVMAVILSVCSGFYTVYHKVASGRQYDDDDLATDNDTFLKKEHRADFERFRHFLRSLLMHSAIGTVLGGVCTLVGEPQNLLIGERAGWNFGEFFFQMSPATIPIFITGLVTCVILEKTRLFGYGRKIPRSIREILKAHLKKKKEESTASDTIAYIIQGIAMLIVIYALAFHLAAVGLIGLMNLVILTSFLGYTQEQQIGKAFEESLPFTALLIVFFAIIAVIHEQHLFVPIIDYVFSFKQEVQPLMFFIVNGVLSMISDNVFVATIYINEVKQALDAGTISREHFENLVVAINVGTNIPSIATPNGQAAFLFLLTSSIAPLARLSYGRMVWMALPYTVVLSIVSYITINLFFT
ncbi:MAG: sodium/proton antiporter NhaB [Alphaproteobacteria bacterium]